MSDMQHQVPQYDREQAIVRVREATKALRLEVPQEVADDVEERVEDVIRHTSGRVPTSAEITAEVIKFLVTAVAFLLIIYWVIQAIT